MTDYPLDIIIPVWNSPVAVRAALASFATDSPMARLVMVNNGSERETEAILHEFAEALDDRALLLSTGRNIGTVAALNLGLSRSTAQFALVSNPFVRLPPGWFDPVLSLFEATPAAGAVCLRSDLGGGLEADHGSFATMVLRRELLQRTADFDAQMDGALWALRDFARRATACGFRTFWTCCRQLRAEQCQELGSLARRVQRETAARQLYLERWGTPTTYLLNCADSLPVDDVGCLKETLLAAARQGDLVTVTAASRLVRQLQQEGVAKLHENISLFPLPRLFAGKALRRVLERTAAADELAMLINTNGAIDSPLPRLTFAEFAARIQKRKERYYQGGVYARSHQPAAARS